MKNNDQSLTSKYKKEANDPLLFIHNCTQEHLEHIMLQTIAIEQVKEALDQFNKVCLIKIDVFL